ncbi:30S ribosomal protein S9 [Candidatus Roizmanbacteria bacterium]|nr:30S ribosomal protein S9 [Candidatus Roizmanbacteria bacterium]
MHQKYHAHQRDDGAFLKQRALQGGDGTLNQLGAVIHGLSRALQMVDKEQYRGTLKKEGLLTRDSRKKERRKVGRAGKARKQKQSPKR